MNPPHFRLLILRFLQQVARNANALQNEMLIADTPIADLDSQACTSVAVASALAHPSAASNDLRKTLEVAGQFDKAYKAAQRRLRRADHQALKDFASTIMQMLPPLPPTAKQVFVHGHLKLNQI